MVDLEDCQRSHEDRYPITEQQLCAKAMDNATEPIDTCYGDSGGPLVQYDYKSGKNILTGITSFGGDCGDPQYPGVYASVEHFIGWINMVCDETSLKMMKTSKLKTYLRSYS